MRCSYCGTENPNGSEYCQECGSRIEAKTTVGKVIRFLLRDKKNLIIAILGVLVILLCIVAAS